MIAPADFQLGEAEFQVVRDVVYKHCGISLNDEKIALVRARIAKQMREGQFRSAREYLDHVLADRSGQAFTGFINSISTNLTSFFRENEHFDYLGQTILPALLSRKQQTGDGRFLAWSATCSSGEEPYSMAITLLDAASRFAGPLRWDLRILATDISTAMLATARQGIYRQSRLSPVPAKFRTPYFVPHAGDGGEEDCFEVSPDLRRIVQVRHLNLMDAWPFKGPFEIIFCRNSMIYFDKPTQQKLVERFWNCLKPGGYLFTGHSESLTNVSHRFVNCRPSIYQKDGK